MSQNTFIWAYHLIQMEVSQFPKNNLLRENFLTALISVLTTTHQIQQIMVHRT